ncbi:MAG TPA: hypothetical protein VMB05_12100 [Solirubrobacteraceae bacterium]|nr:hypothetical protein [Solirubrobacteraceae bacterium]
MNRKLFLIALAASAPFALPSAEATAQKPSTAYFKVRLTASQGITWNEDVVVHSPTGRCDGVAGQQGNGTSGLEMHSEGWQTVVVKRVGGYATFSFAGGQPDTPALGHLEREGTSQTRGITPPTDPYACPKPGIPTAPECGERELPNGARVALEWDTPAAWPDNGTPVPLAPSLFISGPYSRDPMQMVEAMTFKGCPGIPNDYIFGLNTGQGYDSGSAALPVSTLFGRKPSFQLHAQLDRTSSAPMTEGETGSFPIRTQLRWKAEFKRIPAPR